MTRMAKSALLVAVLLSGLTIAFSTNNVHGLASRRLLDAQDVTAGDDYCEEKKAECMAHCNQRAIFNCIGHSDTCVCLPTETRSSQEPIEQLTVIEPMTVSPLVTLTESSNEEDESYDVVADLEDDYCKEKKTACYASCSRKPIFHCFFHTSFCICRHMEDLFTYNEVPKGVIEAELPNLSSRKEAGKGGVEDQDSPLQFED